MSLINNMLLDLDKNSHSNSIAITDGLHAAANTPRSISHKKRTHWLAIFGLVTLLAMAALWTSQKYQPKMLAVIADWPATLEKAIKQNITSENNEAIKIETYKTTTAQAVIRNKPKPLLIAEKKPVNFQSKTTTGQVKKTSTIKPKKASTPTLIKTPTKPDPLQMAAYQYAEATHQLAQQQLPLALISLRSALQLNPLHIKARSVLAQKLTDLQQHKEAEQLLQTGIRLMPQKYHFSQLLAKLMISQGRHEKALNLLESRLKNTQNIVQNDAEYLALLAMQYQKLQQHNAATNMFNKALKIQPRKNTWWLGLAISLEALQQQTLAKRAYLRAATGKQLPVNLQKFTVEKIALLDEN